MNHRLVVSSALASVLALGLVEQAAAADTASQEKCFGIAKAGQNDCASLGDVHGCAGQSAAAGQPEDWNYVAKGTCKELHGMSEAEAKARLEADAKAGKQKG